MKLDFSGLKILVIGDPMVDVYKFGHVDRVSPEAPVPVFITDKEDAREGGAANVVNQLRALGCEVREGWDTNDPVYCYKTRYMVGSHQLLREDEDRTAPNFIPSLNGFHAIVISDYAKGACTPEICQEAIASGLPVIVDPKGKDWSKYEGCALICPNEKECPPDRSAGFVNILHKKGERGLTLDLIGQPLIDVPAVAKHVYDVTGAGDTVVAVMAACWAAKINVVTACKLSNAAAGYVVGEVGTTVCPLAYLQEYAHSL